MLVLEIFFEVYRSYIEWKSHCLRFFVTVQFLRIIECKVRIKIAKLKLKLKLKLKSVKVVNKFSSFQNYRFLVVEFCWLMSCGFILGDARLR